MSFNTGNISKMNSGTPDPRDRVASPMRRFSATVSRGKMSRPCGTYPRPSDARAYGGSEAMLAPSHAIDPERIGKRPIRHLSSVVLPTPLRPSSVVQRPAGTSKPTSRRMWLPP